MLFFPGVSGCVKEGAKRKIGFDNNKSPLWPSLDFNSLGGSKQKCLGALFSLFFLLFLEVNGQENEGMTDWDRRASAVKQALHKKVSWKERRKKNPKCWAGEILGSVVVVKPNLPKFLLYLEPLPPSFLPLSLSRPYLVLSLCIYFWGGISPA